MSRFFQMSRLGLLSGLLVISSLAASLSPLLTSQVLAASDYDQAIRTTDEIILTNYDTATTLDVTNTYVPQMQSCNTAAYTSFSETLSSETGKWLVWTNEQSDVSANGMKNVVNIIWSTTATSNAYFGKNGSGAIQWLNAGFTSEYNWFQLRIESNGSTTCYYNSSYSGYHSVSNNVTSDTDRNDWGKQFLFVTNGFTVTYPTGYEGEEIPVEATPDLREPLTPKILYLLKNDELTVNYVGDTQIPLNYISPVCNIEFNKFDLKYEIINGEDEIVETKVVKCTEEVVFNLPGFDEYTLRVAFQDSNGVEFSDDNGNAFTNYKALVGYYELNYGQSYIGGTDQCESTTEDSFTCVAPSIYEDCTTYGADIIGGFGCQFRNFGVWLKTTLMELFVPRSSVLTGKFADLQTAWTAQSGALGQAINYITSLLSNVVSMGSVPSCSLTLGDEYGTFFGTPVSFNVCQFENISPAVFYLMQALLITLSLIGLLFALHRKYLEVVA